MAQIVDFNTHIERLLESCRDDIIDEIKSNIDNDSIWYEVTATNKAIKSVNKVIDMRLKQLEGMNNES